jgi:hypothetical protein
MIELKAEGADASPRTASQNDPHEWDVLRQANSAFIHSAPTGDSAPRFGNMKKLEHDPEKHALGLDPRVGTGFPKRSCSNKKIERDDDSKKSHPALEFLT